MNRNILIFKSGLSHNYGNLLKRTVTTNLAKFHPDAAERYSDLESFLNQADKTFTAAEIQKITKSKDDSDFPRSLNAFLETYQLSDNEKDKILAMRHDEYESKSETEKEKLRANIRKFRKIQEC